MSVSDSAPAVLPAEQVGAKGWIRDMLCLELAEDYDANHITSMLQEAWSNFRQRVPVVGCEGVFEGDDVKPAGKFKLQPYAEGEIADFVIKDHRGDDELPSFAQLKAQNFPNSAMDDEKLCIRGRAGIWPRFGIDRIATNMMQANLIKGGLLLSHMCFHAFGDATAMWKLAELFAEDLRRAQGLPVEPAEVHTADRSKLLHSTGEHISRNFAEEHKEFTHLPFTPTELPEGLTKVPHHAHIFRFTPEAIRALKEECAPSNVRLLKDLPADQLPTFISTNDAITALLWRSLQRAEQAENLPIATDKQSVIQVALDIRRRAHVPIHPHTIGNLMGFTATTLPLYQVIETASLADLAVLVRQVVAKSGKSYYDELAHYVENMDDIMRLVPTAFLDMPGPNVLTSNWSKMDFYGIEWGPTFGNHIKAFRTPAGGVCAGFQVLLPSPPDAPKGTIELLVDVSASGWPHLLKDETWNRYALNPTTSAYA